MLQELKNRIKMSLVPQSKLVVLNYHQLGKVFDPKVHNKSIWNSVSFFENQMNYLKQNHTIVSLKEGVERLKKGLANETIVAITFDDGDASVTSLVMPILEHLDIPATFFINTAYDEEKIGYWYNLGPYFEDNKLIEASTTLRNTMDKAVYQKLLKLEDQSNEENRAIESPFYSKIEQFETCRNSLFHFGLHGHEHLRFSMLTREKQKENLQRNIDAMTRWPNYVPYFAIPFGQPKDWNIDTLEIAKELNVIPFLAYHGYNTLYRTPLLRFSVDGINLRSVFNNFSPFQKTYYKLNNVNL